MLREYSLRETSRIMCIARRSLLPVRVVWRHWMRSDGCLKKAMHEEAIAKLKDAKNRPFGVPRHAGGSPTHSSMFSPPPWREAAKIIDFSHRWSFTIASEETPNCFSRTHFNRLFS